MERALIEATLVRYPANYDPTNRTPVDQAFANAMASVYALYPDDHNIATIYAVALFLLEDRRGYRDLDDPDLQRLHGVLTRVLAQDIKHPGACHLYIHATESSQQPELALACADHLASTVPLASHIQHMPSHTWNEVGLWGRSVRANIAANNTDLLAAEGKGFSYGPSHNLHMLLFAASYDGQGAVATQAGKDYRKYASDAQFEATTLIRFGRFDEVLAVGSPARQLSLCSNLRFCQGLRHAKERQFEWRCNLIADPAGVRRYHRRQNPFSSSEECCWRAGPISWQGKCQPFAAIRKLRWKHLNRPCFLRTLRL